MTFPPPFIFQTQVLGDFLIFVGKHIGKLVWWALLDLPKQWNQHSRRIREMGRLDDRTLKDIGLTRFEFALGTYGTHPGHPGA